jgi:hypothetical protein
MIFDLPFIGFTKADDVDRITPWGEHYDMQPIPYVSHCPITTFAVVESIIFQDQGRRPFKVPNQCKRESTFFNIASVFGWVISSAYHYRSHNKSSTQSVSRAPNPACAPVVTED